MFRDAIAKATGFTRPVVISQVNVDGACASGIGSFVVVNEQGWIITAGHIVEQLALLANQVAAKQERERKAEAIKADASLDKRARQKALQELGHTKPSDAAHCSAWWAMDGVNLVDIQGINGVDIAVGRLDPFEPRLVDGYPSFRDPSAPAISGVSLCKLGFPFHEITPIWHADRNGFELPAGSLPPPFFPIEGMLTRCFEFVGDGGASTTPPNRVIETSSPGLRGQSGGPTFDKEGTVWAIQSRTTHLPLGFACEVPGPHGKHVEHQFLNVGWGVHTSTFLPLLDRVGAKYQIAK